MRVANTTDVQWTAVSGHRAGRIEFKRLLHGMPGAPDNFELSLVRTFGDYATPRHRHNFDQIRYGVSGTMNYAPRKDLVGGSVAYFPEGTFYGPQRMAGESLVLLLQFGGPSGQGFMRYEELQAGHAALAARGSFAGGVYRGHEGGTQDGYEAVWERVHGRPIAYPPPRFAEPILMSPAHYAWTPSPGESGVAGKLLGVFSERQVEIRCLRLRPGAAHEPPVRPGARLLVVLMGAVRCGDAEVTLHGAALQAAGERARLIATAATEVLAVGMPIFTA
jgi:hypothetical protein